MPESEKRRRGRPRAFNPVPDAGAVQALDRGLAILKAVSQADAQSLSEVAARAGLPVSTAYRMLVTLQKHGMVEFDEAAQLWSVGVGAYTTGAAFLRRRKLADRSRAVMQDLVERTGETANLGLLEADGVVFVSQVETHEAIRAFFRPGTRGPLHASGIGKAILAGMPVERVSGIIGRTGLAGFTPRTLTEPSALMRDLRESRLRGWATDDEERHAGMRCVAAAIFDDHGEPVGGLSVSGPTVRVTPDQAARFGPLVRDAALEVTRATGGRLPD
jgi:IclR family acetate operon transcriptional repressor